MQLNYVVQLIQKRLFFKNRKSARLKYSKYECGLRFRCTKFPDTFGPPMDTTYVLLITQGLMAKTEQSRLYYYNYYIYNDLKNFASHKPYNDNQESRSQPLYILDFVI